VFFALVAVTVLAFLASETIVLSDVPLTNLVHVPHISELELGAKQERKSGPDYHS